MSTIYDCGPPDVRHPLAKQFPCRVVIVDPQTRERIPNVFYADTAGTIQRYVMGPDGKPLCNPDGSRLDVVEQREWVALSMASNQVVDQSKGASW